MKSPLEASEKQIAQETSAKPEKPVAAAVIDTSKMSKGKREALELAEAARDPLEDRGSFASNLFVGRYDFSRIHPYPAQTARTAPRVRNFLSVCKNICAKISMPTKSIERAKYRKRTSMIFSRWVRSA